MSFSAYAKSVFWEYVFLTVACIALEYSLFNAFYITESVHHSPIAAVVTAVFSLILFAVAYNSATTRIGGVLCAAVAVAALVACACAAPGGDYLKDQEGNLLYFALVIVAVVVLGFLLSRKRAGTVLFFIAGAFACSWTQFFYERYEFAWLLAFLIASMALLAYKNFEHSVQTVSSASKVSFAAGALVSCLAVVVAVAAGCAVWFAIIQPLHPGAFVIELVNEDRSLEELEVKGVGSEYQTPNMELTSDQTNDQSRTTDDLKLDENGNVVPAHLNSNNNSDALASGSYQGMDEDSTDNSFDQTTNVQLSWQLLLIPLALLVAIMAYFIARRFMRRHRLAKFAQGSPSKQVESLFLFLMGKMGRLGLAVPEGATLAEHAANNEPSFQRLDKVTGVSFAALSDVYARTAYGKAAASDEEVSMFVQYYRGFWKAAREYLGPFKYFFKSFKL